MALQGKPVSRDKLAKLTGNNQELIRFFETLQGDSTTLESQVLQAIEDAANARFQAEQAIADAMSARQAADSALTPGEVLALASSLIKPERKQPRPDDAAYVIAGQMYGSR
jgi:hypothetical protein